MPMSFDPSNNPMELYHEGVEAHLMQDGKWLTGTLKSIQKDQDQVNMVFSTDGKDITFSAKMKDVIKDNYEKLPPLKNPAILDGIDDLTNLNYMHEPAVLHNLESRFKRKAIYTYSGLVLVAVNPFESLPIYSHGVVKTYSGKRRGELEPHLFAVAEDAFREMIREQMNQSVIIAGESGAGKTVSAKYILRYFATVEGEEEVSEVEKQVLATNPIMEAFGNAKTTRNDNSSRFGRYIEVQFNHRTQIVGANIRTYLLEKSRVAFQAEEERNYHVFYQLCAGASAEQRKMWSLNQWDSYSYLNQGGCGIIQRVDDGSEFNATCQSLDTIGINKDMQNDLFQCLAAILHIGNIKITDSSRSKDKCDIDDAAGHLATACSLLGINGSEFKKWLSHRQIKLRSETIAKEVSGTDAISSRDAISKHIYSTLFDWLTGHINKSLACEDQASVRSFIGVLDIYGFEHFKVNSFEQFCINLANEKLQQEFNKQVFRVEQELYLEEGIEWSFIDFADNKICLELIESKFGIMSLLDEESRLPKGSDASFIQKIHSNFGNEDSAYKDYYKKPRIGSHNTFTINHYAAQVTYSVDGFLDKNKDALPDEHKEMLLNSENDFVRTIFAQAIATAPTPKALKRQSMSMNRKPTVSSVFKNSLSQLTQRLGETHSHYIRCIKPNAEKKPNNFDNDYILGQLRACGVVETIRISCVGYPTRWKFDDFTARYGMLLDRKKWPKDPRKFCIAILDKVNFDPRLCQIGKTRIFFRAGQVAYIEKLRHDRLSAAVMLMQNKVKQWLARKRYLHTRKCIIQVQSYIRRHLAQQELQKLKEEYLTKLELEEQKKLEIARMQEEQRQKEMEKKSKDASESKPTSTKRSKSSKSSKSKGEASLKPVLEKAKSKKKSSSKATKELPPPPIATMSSNRDRKGSICSIRHSAIDSADHMRLRQEVSSFSALAGCYQRETDSLREQINKIISKGDRESVAYLKDQLRDVLENSFKAESKFKTKLNAPQQKMLDKMMIVVEDTEFMSEKDILRIVMESALDIELYEGLVTLLKIPQAKFQNLLLRPDVVFPAHMLALRSLYLWKYELIDKLSSHMELTCSSIRTAIENYSSARCAFWLSNTMELIHLYKTALSTDDHAVLGKGTKLNAQGRACLESACEDLSQLAEDIFHAWTKELKRNLAEVAIPAIIEYEGLDDLKVKPSMLPKMISSQVSEAALSYVKDSSSKRSALSYVSTAIFRQPKNTIDTLIQEFNKILRVIKKFHLPPHVQNQVLEVLLIHIGVICFNHLLFRRQFSNWRRGLQIQYNVTRVMEWCERHGAMQNTRMYFERLLHVAKLLQLPKESESDLDNIIDVCALLSLSQIHKLLLQYYPIADEEPVSRGLISAVGDRAILSSTPGAMILDVPEKEPFHQPTEFEARQIDGYLPNQYKFPLLIKLSGSI